MQKENTQVFFFDRKTENAYLTMTGQPLIIPGAYTDGEGPSSPWQIAAKWVYKNMGPYKIPGNFVYTGTHRNLYLAPRGGTLTATDHILATWVDEDGEFAQKLQKEGFGLGRSGQGITQDDALQALKHADHLKILYINLFVYTKGLDTMLTCKNCGEGNYVAHGEVYPGETVEMAEKRILCSEAGLPEKDAYIRLVLPGFYKTANIILQADYDPKAHTPAKPFSWSRMSRKIIQVPQGNAVTATEGAELLRHIKRRTTMPEMEDLHNGTEV